MKPDNKINPILLAVGEDNRLSTSKFQMLLWTATILATYLVVFINNLLIELYSGLLDGTFDLTLPAFPSSLMWAMGMGGVTAISAKAMSSTISKGSRKRKVRGLGPEYGDLIRNDAGKLDLAKFQLLAWTFVALLVYIVTFIFEWRYDPETLVIPPVSDYFLFLMGLGNGNYLLNKANDLVAKPPLETATLTNEADFGTEFFEPRLGKEVENPDYPLTQHVNTRKA